MASNETGERPLARIKVVDFSTVVSGPLCTQILADLGADVIKVEPLQGDITRMMGPPFRDGMSGLFAQVNRNKRGIAIDLKQPDGQALARRLCRNADVVVENFRPRVAGRLAIDYDACVAENPRLIYVSINGFGPSGPYAEQPAYDNVIQGLSGFLPAQGGTGAPDLVRSIIADKTAALTATYAVLAALFARERNGGRGQKIDVPMLDAFAAFILPELFGSETFVPKDEGAPAFQLHDVMRVWPTADGYVVMMIIEDRQFHGLCRILGRDDLIDDPRCGTLLARIMNLPELLPLLEAELRQHTTAALVERAREHQVPLAPVHGIADFMDDPQVRANRIVAELDHPTAGRMRLLRNPVRFASGPSEIYRLPPGLGEHTDAVLGEHGLANDEIAALRRAGTVG